MQIDLASPTDVLGFRAQANSLLAHQVLPADASWEALVSTRSGEAVRGIESRPPPLSSALHSIVPRSFVRLTELVVLHRDAVRFDLLYRLLWRLVHEPHLAAAPSDPDMAAAQAMAHAVRREVFRTRQSVALRAVGDEATPLRFAWCEPRHHVTEEVAQWLSRNDTRSPWLLVSPDRSVLWQHRRLWCGPGVPRVAAHAADPRRWQQLARDLAG